MAELYPWFVLVHIVGLVVFVAAHAVSAVTAFRMRRMREPREVATALARSRITLLPMYIGLLLLVVGGIGSAVIGDLWSRPWNIASALVLVAVLAVMYTIGSPYYERVREAVGSPGKHGAATEPSVSEAELAVMLRTRRPEVLALAGGVGLVVLSWLMIAQPG